MSKEYQYFDTPDGEDTLKKLWASYKIAIPWSLGIATTDVMLYSHPKGYLPVLGRYAYICLPLMGITTAFVLVKNMSTNVRGKDDKINWVIGACAAGTIVGAWRRSGEAGFFACAAFTAAALIKKHALQNGWILFDKELAQQPGEVRSVRQDFTLTKHRPGNWTTGQ